jgi:hypothetical protein
MLAQGTDEALDLPAQRPKDSAQPRFLSVAAVAAILDVHPVTLYREITANRFPHVRLRGRYVIPSKALDDIEQQALLVRAPATSVVLAGRGI